MKHKIKILVLYQVIMHYRLPFYEHIEGDNEYEFCLLFGRGKEGSKLVNTNQEFRFKNKKLFDFRIPLKTANGEAYIPVSPFLFFHLIVKSPQIIFSEGSSSIVNSSIAFIYAKIFRKKFVWWSLGMLEGRTYRGLRKWLNKWEKVIENNSDAIFTYSSKGRDYFLSRGVEVEKIFVGVNVIDTDKKLKEIERYRNVEFSFPYQDKFNLVFIGSITSEKNLELLIDVVKRFNLVYKDVGMLHIIGDGNYLTVIDKYIKDNNVADSILLHGRINEGASKILSKCDVMVLPGLGGLAIVEAMLNNLPVITGKADGTEYDLVDDSNGFIIETINEQSLFEKIEFLYLDEDVRQSMGLKSFERITKEFSFSKYYSKFKEAINYALWRHQY